VPAARPRRSRKTGPGYEFFFWSRILGSARFFEHNGRGYHKPGGALKPPLLETYHVAFHKALMKSYTMPKAVRGPRPPQGGPVEELEAWSLMSVTNPLPGRLYTRQVRQRLPLENHRLIARATTNGRSRPQTLPLWSTRRSQINAAEGL